MNFWLILFQKILNGQKMDIFGQFWGSTSARIGALAKMLSIHHASCSFSQPHKQSVSEFCAKQVICAVAQTEHFLILHKLYVPFAQLRTSPMTYATAQVVGLCKCANRPIRVFKKRFGSVAWTSVSRSVCPWGTCALQTKSLNFSPTT